MSLHQIHLAKEFADRIIGIAGGVVVFDGPAKDLSEAMLHRIYRVEGNSQRAAIPAAAYG
jgi:phosphonate transport system ATP-binding protein